MKGQGGLPGGSIGQSGAERLQKCCKAAVKWGLAWPCSWKGASSESNYPRTAVKNQVPRLGETSALLLFVACLAFLQFLICKMGIT